MNNRFITYLISLSMLLGASSAFAVIYQIEEWVKETDANKPTVICFSDLHNDYGNQKITDKQRTDIIAQARKQKAHVIVEDGYVVDDGIGVLQNKHAIVAGVEGLILRDCKRDFAHFIIDASPLCGLIQACKAQGVSHSNVEFRQYLYNEQDMEAFKLSLISNPLYSQMLEKHREAIDLQLQNIKITFADVAAGLEKIYKEIAKYDDKELKLYYAAIENDTRASLIKEAIREGLSCHDVCSRKDFIEIIRTVVKRVKEESDQKTSAEGRVINIPKDQQQRINEATLGYEQFFYRWIDARIIRRVAQSPSHMTFVCAGGRHIENISEGLVALGYTLKKSKGKSIDYNSEEDLRTIIENQSIDIAQYFNQRSSYSRLFYLCTAAAVGVLGYLGYQYLYKKIFGASPA